MLEHIVKFERGYDCNRFECINGSNHCYPDSGNSHGFHGLNIRFLVKGSGGAVQFLLSTDWLPQQVKPDSISHRSINSWTNNLGRYPYPMDLGYHAKKPKYKGQTIAQDSCEFCGGEPCYYDGSTFNASDAMYALVNGGDEALWKFLEEYYQYIFNGKVYPTPAEYPKKRRS